MKREFRFVRDAEVSLRGTPEAPVISGYAAIFNSPTVIAGQFRETIKPGAFKRAIAEAQDVRGLVNHDPSMVLGRTKSGTLRLFEDAKGLRYEIDPPNASYANDLMESLRRGDIDASSFGFIPKEQQWGKEAGMATRDILDCDLFDVSPVTYPAYDSTSASVRTMFPDGEIEVPEQRDAAACACDCAECVGGSCADCSNGDCADETCSCGDAKEMNSWKTKAEMRARLSQTL
jgi:HK97 family phage prohead protease